MDYEGVPFRCRRCHKVGHLYRDSPLISKKANGDVERKIPPKTVQDQGEQLPSTTEGNHADPPQSNKAHSQETLKKHGRPPLRPPSPPLIRAKARATAGVAVSSGMNSYSPNPTHLFTYDGLNEFLAASKNNGIGVTPLPFPLACPFHTPARTFSNTTPSLLDPPPDISPNPSTGPPSPHYQTRSKAKQKLKASDHFDLDLILSPFPAKHPRGRPSSLSKAQIQAGGKIALGKQSTIHRALRASNPSSDLPP